MAEIWNLSALCRCCHTDGQFKSLQSPYVYRGGVEVYCDMLLDTFGLTINPPPQEVSYSICDECIVSLRNAARFKQQVLECEHKFDEYCKNEQAFSIPTDFIKVETDSLENDTENDKKNVLAFVKDRELKCDVLNSDDNDVDFDDAAEPIKTEDKKACKIEICLEPKYTPPAKKGGAGKRTTRPVKQPAKDKSAKKPPIKRERTHPSLVVKVKTESGHLYTCKACSGSYESLKTLHLHIRTSHKRSYDCTICNENFNGESTFKRHMITHNETSPFPCTYCDKKFSNYHNLTTHINTHTKQKIYICDVCSKSFATRQIIIKHLRLHEGKNKKCMCEICGHSFNDRTNMMIHVRTVHEKLRPFPCTLCSKTFSAKKHLKVHIMKHTGERPYQCELCLKSFICITDLKCHRKRRHGVTGDRPEGYKVNEVRYRCVVCGDSFESRGQHRIHVKTHAGQLPFKCNFCPKDFTCKYSMKRHINEHFGVKPHECPICEKRFVQKDPMKRHLAIVHDPQRATRLKEQCDMCKLKVYDLELHRKIHLKRPYACHLCSKTYAANNGLNRHLKESHYQKRGFACDLCDKKYMKSGTLKRHKLKMHNVKTEIDELPAYAIKNNYISDTGPPVSDEDE